MRAEIISAPKVDLPSISIPKLQPPNTEKILISLRGEGEIRYSDYTFLFYTTDPNQQVIHLIPDTFGDMTVSITPELLNSYEVRDENNKVILTGHINYLYVEQEKRLKVFLKENF